MLTIERKVHFGQGHRQRRQLCDGEALPVAVGERIPRIARMMALAIRFDQLIRDGVVHDQADIARLGRVSRARVTQIMGLLNLAPEIQESVLFVRDASMACPLRENALREISKLSNWSSQRKLWAAS